MRHVSEEECRSDTNCEYKVTTDRAKKISQKVSPRDSWTAEHKTNINIF